MKCWKLCGNIVTCWTNEALLHLTEAKAWVVCAGRTGQNPNNTATEAVMTSWTGLDILSWQAVGPHGTVFTQLCPYKTIVKQSILLLVLLCKFNLVLRYFFPYLLCLRMCHQGILWENLSLEDNSVPLDKCFLSLHPWVWQKLLLLHNNNLKICEQSIYLSSFSLFLKNKKRWNKIQSVWETLGK